MAHTPAPARVRQFKGWLDSCLSGIYKFKGRLRIATGVVFPI